MEETAISEAELLAENERQGGRKAEVVFRLIAHLQHKARQVLQRYSEQQCWQVLPHQHVNWLGPKIGW